MGGITRGSPAFFTPCDFCGNKFKIIPSRFRQSKHHFCKSECQDNYARGKYRKRTKRVCKTCGSEFWSRDAWTKDRRGGGDYCSKKCRWKLKPKYTLNQRHSASAAIRRAIKKGVLVPQQCVECGYIGLELEAHHYLGYDKMNWLNVRWYCARHHTLEHENLRKKGIRLG